MRDVATEVVEEKLQDGRQEKLQESQPMQEHEESKIDDYITKIELIEKLMQDFGKEQERLDGDVETLKEGQLNIENFMEEFNNSHE